MIGRFAAAIFLGALAAVPARAASIAALAQPSQDWVREWQAKDVDAVLALFTDDGIFVDADGSRIAGKPALRKFFANVLDHYSARPNLQSVDSFASGDLAYDMGDYRETVTPVAKPGSVIATHGTYFVILRRVGGHWRIAQQVWTGVTSAPIAK